MGLKKKFGDIFGILQKCYEPFWNIPKRCDILEYSKIVGTIGALIPSPLAALQDCRL